MGMAQEQLPDEVAREREAGRVHRWVRRANRLAWGLAIVATILIVAASILWVFFASLQDLAIALGLVAVVGHLAAFVVTTVKRWVSLKHYRRNGR